MLTTLRIRAFSYIWGGVAAAFMAQWLVALAAQWYLLGVPGGPQVVPLVQVAMMLPMALLAIPAGVVADNADRPRLVLVVQGGVLLVEALLGVLILTEALNPIALLLLLAALASCMVLTFTAVQSMVPDIVPRHSVAHAAALLAVATNSARIIGPAIGGFVIAAVGVGGAVLSALPMTLLLIAVMASSAGRVPHHDEGERFVSALRSGARFVRHSPQVLKLVVRGTWFTLGIAALLSLLPVAATRLGADSTDFGLLLAGQGVGAVLGAISQSRMRRVASANAIGGIGFLTAGLAVLGSAVAPSLATLAAAVFLSGWSWTVALASFQAGIQVYLPAWVRARGVGVLLTGVYGGQAIGALIFGSMATVTTVPWALSTAGFFLLLGSCLTLWLPLKDLDDIDRSRASGLEGLDLPVRPIEAIEQVQVRIQYHIPDSSHVRFLELMHHLRRVRLRSGALRWQLLRQGIENDLFVEEFMVRSWAEFEHMRDRRLTAFDLGLEQEAADLSRLPPAAFYMFRTRTLHTDVPRTSN